MEESIMMDNIKEVQGFSTGTHADETWFKRWEFEEWQKTEEREQKHYRERVKQLLERYKSSPDISSQELQLFRWQMRGGYLQVVARSQEEALHILVLSYERPDIWGENPERHFVVVMETYPEIIDLRVGVIGTIKITEDD